jgi:hypothetical protein
MAAEFALASEQHRNVLTPTGLQRGLAVDVDFFDGGAGCRRHRRQRLAHLVAKMAVGARQKRKAHDAALTANRRFRP